MKEQLLIWQQNYDVVDFNCVIDKVELEDYITHFVEKFLLKSNLGVMNYKYVSHEITEWSGVIIKFEYDEHAVLGRVYPAGIYIGGFEFVELNKMPIWRFNNR